MTGQERLQAHVIVAVKGLAFDFALVADEAGGPGHAWHGPVLLLEYQHSGGGGGVGDLHVLAGGEVGIAAGFEAMLAGLNEHAGGAFEDIDEVLVDAGVAGAVALFSSVMSNWKSSPPAPVK